MFSGRLPDHLLCTDTVLDEAASFEAMVERHTPLKEILARLNQAKRDLTSAWENAPTGSRECSAPLHLTEIRFGDTLKVHAALAMDALWDSFLAWKAAEEAAIAAVKVLCCTVDVALKGFAKLANYPAKLLFRQRPARGAIWMNCSVSQMSV